MKYRYKLLGALFLAILSVSSMVGQTATYDPSVFINIDINSGNPTYPYPQFLEYKGGGKSLAKYNAEGVTHADMEKAGREAYEIMMHRCRYMGGTHCGVDYITFNHESVPGNYGTFVSEGDGYALLAAAIFADQKTFNGLYMWVHDHRFSGVERFQDGRKLRDKENDYAGPYLAGWQCDETTTSMSPCHSATDGDVDIAMAMLIAYKQWGEFMMQDGQIVKDYAGNPISLKYEAQRVIGALVDTLGQMDKGSGELTGYLCGVIGIDGYEKRGNSWGELTRWRFSDLANETYPNFNGPHNGGPNLYGIYGGNYIDYDAPAYFEEFWRWLKNGDGVDKKNEKIAPWEIHQFKRAAASGNWLNKQAYNQGLYASIGMVTMTEDGKPEFGVYVDGEDFRYPWRHMMDYLWHGHANYDWDPVTHQVIDGTNTSEYDMGVRHADLLRVPLAAPGGDPICKQMGASPDPGQPSWFGVSQIPQQWRPDGGMTSAYHTNYSVGAGAPAAVISEDLELLADVYRQCEIMWDGNNTAAKLDPEERYIGSTPKYFHGWFRTLGMLICTGNLAAPEDMKPIANAKVYMSVDKTYAYQGDDVTYGVQYRNYGTLDAKDVKITTKLDKNYTFVSATKGGVYDASSHSISWKIGSIPGFKTGKLEATMDSVFFTVNVADTLNPRICLTSELTSSNCDGWESNEYPNHATYTMERNCVDILASRSLFIEKTANRSALNPKDVVTFTVKFGNKSEGESSWLNGGRDNVRISYGTFMPNPTYQFYSLYRFWNDSYESYINMGNYRVSYFMYDAAAIGLVNEKNPTGWTFVVDNQNDLDKYGYNPETGPITFSYQKIPQGSDEFGKWNQRLMIRFADVLMAPSTHVYDKLDSQYLLHKGVWGPGFIRARLASNPAQDLSTRVTDDWSFDPSVGEKTLDGQGTTFTLISPCWANYDDPGYEITNYARHVCKPASVGNYGRILVEEFDGYTWRRIQGTGPLPGKEAYNVTVVDTIPYELEWVGWADSTALKDDTGKKIEAKYTPCSDPKAKGYTGIVYWTVPEMLVGEEDKLVYKCKARDLGCPDVEDAYYKNVAWIWSDTDSPDSSQVELMTTCAELPPQIEPQTSLFKRADREKAQVGDVISYTVSFVNTLGTRVDAGCKSTDGWQALGNGSLPVVGSNGLKLSTNGSSAYFFGPEKSYGSDGSVYATFGGSPSSTQELYIVFRYNGGTPGKADFKGICMQLMINKDGKNNFGYYLYNNGDLVAKEGLSWQDAMQFPGDYESPTFKFVLNGDHLYMYVNDQEDEWTNVSKDWAGLTAKEPGFFGMYVNSNGNSNTQLTSFITELDYAFDVQLFDRLPAELDNVTNISDKGSLKDGLITWPMVATTAKEAIAPGDSVVRTFEAEVVDCKNYINNLGLATVYGLDSLKVLNTVACGSSCTIQSVSLELAKPSICEGETTTLTATVEPEGKWNYEFFLDKVSLGKPSTKGEMEVSEAGSYTVEVSDPADPSCKKVAKAVTLSVGEIPTVALDPLDPFCAGEAVELPSADGLKWFASADTTKDPISVDLSGLDGQLDPYEFFFTKTNDEGCVFGPEKYEVTVKLTATAKFDTVMVCGETTVEAEVVPSDATVTWMLDGVKVPAPTSFTEAGDLGELTLSATAAGYCDSKASDDNTKLIHVMAMPKSPVSQDMEFLEFVKGTGCQLIYEKEGAEIKPNDPANELAWYKGEAMSPIKDESDLCHDLTKRDDGTVYWVAERTPEGCESEPHRFVVKVNDAPRPTVLPTVICEGESMSSDELADRVVAESSDFEVRWYAAVSGVKGDGDYKASPDALVDAEVGKYEYFVSQYNKVTDAESDVDTLVVSVVGVKKPAVEAVNYCAGDDPKSLGESVTVKVDEENGYFQDGFSWFVDGVASAKMPVVSTDVKTTTEIVYSVAQTYEVANGKFCVGDTASFVVKVSKVDVPTVNGSVIYTTSDIVNDKIGTNLMEKNPNAVATTSDDYKLLWFDADKKPLGEVAPTPTSDPAKVAAGEDQTFTYFVKQTDGNCESELVEVTVVISATPRPITFNLNLCEDEEIGSRSLDDLVKIDANGGDESKFSKRWYADAATAGNGIDFTENPPLMTSKKTTSDAVEKTIYYVTQVNEDGAESGYSEVVVSVYAKPVLEAVPQEAVCEKSVVLAKAWQVANGAEVTDVEYTWNGNAFDEAAAKANGAYTVKGWFDVPAPGEQAVCASDAVDLKFRIDSLSGVKIKASATACPNSEAPISAVYETNVTDAPSFVWTGGVKDATTEATVTLPLAGVAGDTHKFGLQITAGACTKSADDVTIELGNGILDGVITAAEVGNDSIGAEPYPVESGKVTIYSCGSAVTLTANVKATVDKFEWNEVGGTSSYSGKEVAIAPKEKTTYRLTYINECEASLEVTIVPAPVVVTATKSASEVCEGEAVKLTMNYECVEKPTLTWLKDGVAKADGAVLDIAKAALADAGVYSYEARNRGCFVSADVVDLKVKPYAKVVEPTEPFVVKRGDDLTIDLDVAANADPKPSVTWTERGQQAFTGASASLSDVTSDHSYAVALEGDGYCQTNITVDVWVDAAVAVTLTGDKEKVCAGDEVTLTADTTGTGRLLDPTKYSILWEVKSGADFAALAGQSAKAEAVVAPKADAVYRVTITYKDQKVTSEEFAVKVYEPATFTQPEMQTICEGETATIEVADLSFEDAEVVWTADETITTALTGASVTVNPTVTTIYHFTVSREIGCPVEGSARVVVKAKPQLSVTEDTTICAGDKLTLYARVLSGEASKLQWTDMATGETLAETGTLTVMPEADAAYRVTVDGGACGLTQVEVKVAVGQLPVIDTVEVVSRKTVEILASGGDGNYEYKVGAKGEYAADNRIEVTRYSTYDFYVKDGNGCETKRPFTLEAPQVSFKPSFTPNGDGKNDQWEVANLAEAYPDAVVKIFDRYGKKLCEMKASDGSWDGTYQGKKMPATDYWYEVDIDEIDKLYVGHFTLLR